jgi:hypothetical protein
VGCEELGDIVSGAESERTQDFSKCTESRSFKVESSLVSSAFGWEGEGLRGNSYEGSLRIWGEQPGGCVAMGTYTLERG